MTVLRLLATEWTALRHASEAPLPRAEVARLRRKRLRKEIGMAVIVLGAMAMFIDAAQGLSALAV
nr:hypothetical protein [Cupriavidus gilardii]